MEEIGAGGAFQQADLTPKDCFLLDTGRREVYMWFGAESTWHCRALCVRVSRSYVHTLAHTSHDPSTSSLLKEVFRMPACEEIQLQSIEAGTEIEWPFFINSFNDWTYEVNADDGIMKRVCVHWDAGGITDDESDDVNIAPTGQRIEYVSRFCYGNAT